MARPAVLVLVAGLAISACSAAASPSLLPSAASIGPGPTQAQPGTSTQPSSSPQPSGAAARTLLIDTDVAPDDLVAIAFLLASPQVRIAAITVSGTGEAHCRGGVDVVLRLLERLHAPEVPVACGRERPITGDHAFPDTWRAGADAGSGLDLPSTERRAVGGTASDLIVATAQAVGSLRVLTLGPLTNLADAQLAHPELVDRIDSVDIMGGALLVPGNVSAAGPPSNLVAEWNIYVDPHAAQVVVASGLAVRFVGLDGTNQVPVTQAWAASVQREARQPAALVLAELFSKNGFMTDGGYYLWDPLAAMLAAGYPVGTFSPAHVTVEEAEGPESGFTRPGPGLPNVEYLSLADPALAEETLFATLNS